MNKILLKAILANRENPLTSIAHARCLCKQGLLQRKKLKNGNIGYVATVKLYNKLMIKEG